MVAGPRSLAALFLEHARLSSAPPAASETLETALAAALAAGDAAWPSVRLEPAVFVRHLAGRVGDAASACALLTPERGADLYLACACAHQLPQALAAFERRHLAGAPGYLRPLAADRSFVDDVLQDVRERLFVGSSERLPRIEEYAGRGSLEAFVRVMATRLALDRLEQLRRELPVAEPPDELAESPDPELRAMKAEYREDFVQAVRDVLGTITPEERTLLRLYLVDRLNLAEIGHILGASRATVGRRITDFRRRVLDDTRRLLEERHNVSGDELSSLLRLFHSDLDTSLHGFLVER